MILTTINYIINTIYDFNMLYLLIMFFLKLSIRKYQLKFYLTFGDAHNHKYLEAGVCT